MTRTPHLPDAPVLAVVTRGAGRAPAGAAVIDRGPPPAGAPLVIGHRGAPGYRPEYTLASYELAARMGADHIEPDLVMTKDGVLVARHEPEIGGSTDVGTRPRFRDRRTARTIDGVRHEGWFVEDFTLEELRTLRATEPLPHIRRGNSAHDGRYGIPTFQEVLDLRARISAETGRTLGVAPETKHPSYHASIGLPMEEAVAATLRSNGLDRPDAPVLVLSFEVTHLMALAGRTRVPLVQLIGGSRPALGPRGRRGPAHLRRPRHAEGPAVRRHLRGRHRPGQGTGHPGCGGWARDAHLPGPRRARRRPARPPVHLRRRERVPARVPAVLVGPLGPRGRRHGVRGLLRRRRRRGDHRQPGHGRRRA